MAKGCKGSIKSDSSLSSNHDEPKALSNNEVTKMESENKKISSNDSLRQSSHKFIQKLRKMKLIPMSSSLDDDQSSDIPGNIPVDKRKSSFDVSKTISTPPIGSQRLLKFQVDSKLASNEKPELKGILKIPNKKFSRANSVKDSSNKHNDIQSSQSHIGTTHATNNKENNDGLITSNDSSNNLNSGLNPSTSIKHVTFNEKISRKRYKPRNLAFDETKLSLRQQKILKKFQRNDSLKSRPRNSIDANFMDLSQLQELDHFESSEYESSGDEDEIILTVAIHC